MLIVFSILTEKYFDMKKNQCKEALEIYKTFLNRMTKLSEFLKVAEVMSVCPAGGTEETQIQTQLKWAGHPSEVNLNIVSFCCFEMFIETLVLRFAPDFFITPDLLPVC